jgi:uncharacterized membrane protein
MTVESVKKRETGRPKAAIAGVPVAFLAVWAAIYAVASILPAIPLVGGGTFGGQEFILGIAGVLFGPIAGAVAATVGAIIASFIGPATAYFGLLTFYPHLVGALVAGLLMKNTRNARLIVLVIFLAAVLAWPLLPWFSAIGGYVFAKGAYWPMYLTGLVTLWLSPWAVKQIRSLDPKRVPLGMAIIAWTAYMVNHVYISLGYSALYPEGPEQWVFAFWSGIVPAQRLLLTLVTVVIGSAAVIGLHRAGIRFPAGTGSALDETA